MYLFYSIFNMALLHSFSILDRQALTVNFNEKNNYILVNCITESQIIFSMKQVTKILFSIYHCVISTKTHKKKSYSVIASFRFPEIIYYTIFPIVNTHYLLYCHLFPESYSSDSNPNDFCICD